MAPSPVLRWTARVLSAAAVAFAAAVAYRYQQLPLIENLSAPWTATSSSEETTYCYEAVRTHDEEKPSAQCFSVLDGVFSRVLTADEVTDLNLESDHVNLEAGYAIPGLWDGHGHLLQYGEFLHSVDLFGTRSLADVRARIKQYLASHPDAGTRTQWLRGVGWDQTAFGRMPTADDLAEDPELEGVYVMLDRIDVHCAWVSRPVLDLLGDLPDEVPGGDIVRDPGMGVFCDNAMEIVLDEWPRPSAEFKAQSIRDAMASLNSVGVVGMHDAGARPRDIRLFNELADSDDWTVRVYSMVECEVRNTFCPDDVPQVTRDDSRLFVRSVKLFADGALGSWGSAMIEPYTDHPWTSGSLLVNASALTSVTKSWASAGYQVNIHAIGDLANRYAIDALEAALAQECHGYDSLRSCQDANHRFRIEHSQIIHPDDQTRIHSLGIIPSIQPTHATSDFKYAEDRLGPDRLRSSAYRIRSLLDVRPVLGSDFPVEPPDPFQGIYAAVARRSPHTGLGPGGDSKLGFLEEEALTIDQALLGFTKGAAHGAFLDGKAGVIKRGALADWVVLEKPIEQTSIEELRSMQVKETWVGGRTVYPSSNVAMDGRA